jgi:hypothetical protein
MVERRALHLRASSADANRASLTRAQAARTRRALTSPKSARNDTTLRRVLADPELAQHLLRCCPQCASRVPACFERRLVRERQSRAARRMRSSRQGYTAG